MNGDIRSLDMARTGLAGEVPAGWKERITCFADFAASYADEADRAEGIPPNRLEKLRQSGVLGWTAPTEVGGSQVGARVLGELHYQVGRVCQSTRAVLTAHQLVTEVIARWATAEQRNAWLPPLARGEWIASFALTEEGAGSNPEKLRTTATRVAGGYRIKGRKKWITSGRVAEVVLLSALLDGQPSCLVLRTTSPGFRTENCGSLTGFRGALLADLAFDDVFVPDSGLVGPVGGGLTAMVGTGLDLGRFVTAWGSAGLIERILCEARAVVLSKEGGGSLRNPLVKRLLAEIHVGLETSRALCLKATHLRDLADPALVDAAVVAKYHCTRTASLAANSAIRVMGAVACREDNVVARLARDTRILEIIEGSHEVLESLIGDMWHECFEPRH